MRVKFLRKIPHEVIRDLSDLIATQKSEWSKSNLYIYRITYETPYRERSKMVKEKSQ